MKTSNKILLALGIIPFFVILMIIFSFRNELKKGVDEEILNVDYSNYPVQTYDFAGFDEIEAEGFWEIELAGGSRFNIELSAPEESMDELSVTASGRTLHISSKKYSFSLFNRPKISITMPGLSRMDLKGQCNVIFSDFKMSELDIVINSIANIRAINSSIENFYLSGNGALNADLNNMAVTNARFGFNGAYMIDMRVNGGELSGFLTGPGKLTIWGATSKSTLRADTSGSIIYKPFIVNPDQMDGE